MDSTAVALLTESRGSRSRYGDDVEAMRAADAEAPRQELLGPPAGGRGYACSSLVGRIGSTLLS